ncbi:zinc-binding dehydrogenase [Dankookia sp. P2]|uniref:zinc-binding dehydrogenase n=1 Tax=Dankookia sp. P2 TaxID=3423955 RepID=UPI003D67CB6F
MSSEAKAAHALDAGADATIDYKREDVAERVLALSGGAGVDRVVDIDLSTTAPLLPGILAPGGLCAAYGSNGPAASMLFGPAIMRGIAVRWFIVYELDAAQRAMAVGTLDAWLRAGLVRHAVAARVPLADCAAAHDAVEAGRYMGNLVLDC